MLVACAAVEVSVGDHLDAQVLWVGDGDSLRALVRGGQRDLRLWGIDAPEKDMPGAEQSRAALRALIDDRAVRVEVVAIDDYDRLVVRMTHNGQSVNRAQIAAGHAWWFRRYARQESSFEQAEAAAKATRRGLWSQAEPEAPWAYRARMRDAAP